PLLHVLNFSFLVHDDGRSLRPLVFVPLHVVRFQDSICGEDFTIHVAKERKSNCDLFCECGVCCGAVYTDSKYHGVACFQLGHISLIGLQFLGSATCKCENVKRQDDVFLAAEIAQLHRLPVVRQQSEIRRHVSHLQVRLGNGIFLRRGGKLSRQHQQQEKPDDGSDDPFHRLSPIECANCAPSL